MLHFSWTRIGIASIRACPVRNHRGVELLLEFPTQASDATLRVFRQLLRCCPVLQDIHRLASLVFEFAQQIFEFPFHLANLLALVLQSFQFQATTLPRYFLLTPAHFRALTF